jgi:hypothetical protein
MLHGQVQRILFPLLIVGLLPMSFLSEDLYFICAFFLLAGYMCFSVVNLDSLIRLAAHDNCSPLFLVGRGRVPIHLGTATGYALGLVILVTNTISNDALIFITMGLVVLLSVFVTFVPFEKDRFTEGYHDKSVDVHDTTGHWRARCIAVSKQYHLSARETEIFNMLAKGRGTEFIQNKLFICHTPSRPIHITSTRK